MTFPTSTRRPLSDLATRVLNRLSSWMPLAGWHLDPLEIEIGVTTATLYPRHRARAGLLPLPNVELTVSERQACLTHKTYNGATHYHLGRDGITSTSLESWADGIAVWCVKTVEDISTREDIENRRIDQFCRPTMPQDQTLLVKYEK